jgi:hypothetical protein
VLAGSTLFAVANTLGKAFERTGGTVGTLLATRGVLAWGFNGLLARLNGESLLNVLFCRDANVRRGTLLIVNGVLNAVTVQALFIALDKYVIFGDVRCALSILRLRATLSLSAACWLAHRIETRLRRHSSS